MKNFLNRVTVAEYDYFRKQVMERTHWTRTQYNDRKTGRIKVRPLEREVIEKIVEKLPSNRNKE